MTEDTKSEITTEIARCLKEAKEIRKIVVFGSFLTSDCPADVDVAVFQDSDEDYLSLAMKYRSLSKSVSDRIPLDVIPLRRDAKGFLVEEINKGKVIYER
ncbi:MAG TPA: nucleotidyltransferase domain-containing protein [bacterium]|nr:nucleotidyltransferase domain-containing protein [bacterium]